MSFDELPRLRLINFLPVGEDVLVIGNVAVMQFRFDTVHCEGVLQFGVGSVGSSQDSLLEEEIFISLNLLAGTAGDFFELFFTEFFVI